MKINKAWHEKNRMPKNPTLEERVKWHRAHAKHCACRPIPEKLLSEVKERECESKTFNRRGYHDRSSKGI